MNYAVGVGSQLFIVRYYHKCLVHLVAQFEEKAV